MDNIFLTHATDILGDTDKGLTGSEIIRYCTQYAIKYNISIPVTSIDMLKTTYKPNIPNKRTALLKNLLAFNEEQQIVILNDLCDLPKFKDNEDVKDLKLKINKRFSKTSLDDSIIVETQNSLNKFKKPLKLYTEALEKFKNGIYERNVLDDMRLSLELLVKELLNSNKTLENQIAPLGELLKNKGVNPEVRNSFNKMIDFYTKYQNNYVKHNDLVNPNEMEWIISQTSGMINFLIKVAN